MSMLTGLTTVRMLSWQRYLCMAVWIALVVTGVWWWWDQDQQMNDPAERAIVLIKLHGILAAVTLVLLGSILSTHVRVAWHRGRNRGSGLLALILLAVLSVSGLGLYYADYDTREMVHVVHWWVGVVAAVALPLHVLMGRVFKPRKKDGSLLGKHVRD